MSIKNWTVETEVNEETGKYRAWISTGVAWPGNTRAWSGYPFETETEAKEAGELELNKIKSASKAS